MSVNDSHQEPYQPRRPWLLLDLIWLQTTPWLRSRCHWLLRAAA